MKPFIQKIFLSSEKNFPATAFFIGRIPELHLPENRQEALAVQRPLQRIIVDELFPSSSSQKIPFVYADQCHGSDIAIVQPPFVEAQEIASVDGLMTAQHDVILGITTADCAPVWIVEKNGRAGALVHSGKKGTEAGIVSKAILKMQQAFQIEPHELIITIGPCIRPPCYEVDFAKTIREQAAQAGVKTIHDDQTCTACHLDRYYSYRREKGKTGHMLAVIRLKAGR